MAQQYDNELTFALFQNDKGDNIKRPDYRGEIQIKGEKYRLSGWLASDKNGKQYLRGKAEVIDPNAAPRGQQSAGTFVPAPSFIPKPTGPLAPTAPNAFADQDVQF